MQLWDPSMGGKRNETKRPLCGPHGQLRAGILALGVTCVEPSDPGGWGVGAGDGGTGAIQMRQPSVGVS